MDEFLLELQAILDGEKSKENINKSIDRLQHKLDKLKIQAELDPKVAQKLADDIGKLINPKIVISNIGINQSDLSKTGQQIGQVISDSAEKAIGNVSSKNIGKYFKVSSSDSQQFKKEMEKLVSGWTNGKGKVKDINIQTRTSYDEKEKKNIERLHQATVTYENELNEVIKKTIAWRQIGTTKDKNGEEVALRGFVEVAGQYSKAIDNISAKTDTFVEKQKNAVASAKNSLATIESKLHDQGANKTLANTDFDANGLNKQLNVVRNAINSLDNASRDTFSQAQRDVDREINVLNNLITTLKNAEYAATSLRTKNVATVKVDESNKLDAFVQKMEQSGHYTDELKQSVADLRNQLNGIFNKNDTDKLTAYLNGFSNLQTRFKAIDASAKTVEKSTKLQTNIEAEKKILQVYTNELKEAGVLSSDVKTKIQEMFYSLSKVDSQTGLTTWRAELKGVKAETDAVLKSVTQLSENKLDNIQDKLDRGDYDKDLANLQSTYRRLGLTTDEISQKTKGVSTALDKLKEKNLDTLVQDEKDFTNELKKSKNEASILKTELDKIYNPKKQFKLSTEIQNWLSKNSRASKEAKDTLQAYYHELTNGRVSVNRLEFINRELQAIDAKQRGLGKLGKNLKDQFTEAAQGFTQWLSVSSGVMFLVSKTREAISEIKELDDILTEISKTSDMTAPQLKQLGMDSYDTASKYGRVASDYLTGVQEMNRSGFYGEKGTGMAEQSLLAQSAGDLSSELADKYILALNAAYKYNGETEKINAALDGMNSITNKNSVAMEDMAEAMTKTGTVAAGYRVKVEDLSAIIGTMESVTKLGGDEVGNAAKAILINLQNVTSSKIVDTLDKANASMTEMVNGTEKLRDPISILRDLAKTFNQLDEDDPLRAEILTNIGQKYHANKLSALLQNMDMYDKMLVDYSEGDGSALEESNKSAENLKGTINKLRNSWTEFVNEIIDSDDLKTGVNLFNGLIKTFANISSSGENLRTTLLTIIGTIAQFKSKSGGLMRLNPIINKSPFLATVEFSSDVYDSYVCA